MQQIVAPTVPVAWPWQDEDVTLRPGDVRVHPLPGWQRRPFRTLLTWLLCALLSVGLAFYVEQLLYRHTLSVEQQWITQQSHAQVVCLQRARTPAESAACGQALALAVTQHANAFAQQWVPPGAGNSAINMQSAFNALYAAACYEEGSQTVDVGCLSTLAPRMRAFAVLDAADAQPS